MWVNQPEPKGFGNAVLMAQPFVQNEPCLVHAGDSFIISEDMDYIKRFHGGARLVQPSAYDARIGANQQIISHNENGFLVKTLPEWEAALGALFSNRRLLQDFGTRARATVEERYSLDVTAPKILTALRKAAEH